MDVHELTLTGDLYTNEYGRRVFMSDYGVFEFANGAADAPCGRANPYVIRDGGDLTHEGRTSFDAYATDECLFFPQEVLDEPLTLQTNLHDPLVIDGEHVVFIGDVTVQTEKILDVNDNATLITLQRTQLDDNTATPLGQTVTQEALNAYIDEHTVERVEQA